MKKILLEVTAAAAMFTAVWVGCDRLSRGIKQAKESVKEAKHTYDNVKYVIDGIADGVTKEENKNKLNKIKHSLLKALKSKIFSVICFNGIIISTGVELIYCAAETYYLSTGAVELAESLSVAFPFLTIPIFLFLILYFVNQFIFEHKRQTMWSHAKAAYEIYMDERGEAYEC